MPNGINVAFFGTPFDDDTRELFTTKGLEGNDILEGDYGDDFLDGLDGIDQIKGEVGNDTLEGGKGNDSLFGGTGLDVLNGEEGNDYLEGGSNDDTMSGGIGNDVIYGDNAGADLGVEGNDLIYGGNGTDLIYGEGGNDTVFGGNDNDIIHGGSGNDVLQGDSGNDTIYGNTGNDTIAGGAGSDLLWGGSGADTFVFTPDVDFKNGYVDTIADFNVNEDKIDLSAFALGTSENDATGNDGKSQFAFDDFSNGMTQGLESAFYQMGSDVYIGAKPELGYGLGSLGEGPVNGSGIIIKNVNIDDLGGSNFVFPD
ncbi:MAG: hypothetical protein Tsb0014_29840 [Pleurocapsa sp.]